MHALLRPGAERTLDQVGELAADAGLQLGGVVPAGSRTIIELRLSGRV